MDAQIKEGEKSEGGGGFAIVESFELVSKAILILYT